MGGFVYVWRDRKYGRFYVGSHWGRPMDGYICSSTWMRRAYRCRPQDFRRRIVATIETTHADLLIEEYRWINMIPDEELGVRYYNLRKWLSGHWHTDPAKVERVRNKLRMIAAATPETHRKRQGESLKDRWKDPAFKLKMRAVLYSPAAMASRREKQCGKKASQETREKLRTAKLGKKRGPFSPEHRQKLSASQKGIPRPYARKAA